MCQKRYQGKLFSVLGDSISSLEGYSQPEGAAFYEGMMRYRSRVYIPKDSWWGQVVEALGGKVLSNNSFSGSTVVKRPDYQIPSYGCSDERTSALSFKGISPDVILVYMGTNDWGYGVQVMPSEGAFDDPAVFSVAYGRMLDKLRENYPKAELWCFTLPVNEPECQKGEDGALLRGGHHLDEYCAAIRACAKERNCPIIDLRAACPTFSTVDGFHPDAEGMTTIARAVLGELQGEVV